MIKPFGIDRLDPLKGTDFVTKDNLYKREAVNPETEMFQGMVLETRDLTLTLNNQIKRIVSISCIAPSSPESIALTYEQKGVNHLRIKFSDDFAIVDKDGKSISVDITVVYYTWGGRNENIKP